MQLIEKVRAMREQVDHEKYDVEAFVRGGVAGVNRQAQANDFSKIPKKPNNSIRRKIKSVVSRD